jgi:hypothetical protein
LNWRKSIFAILQGIAPRIVMRQRLAQLKESRRYILWDTELKGFGLRVATSGTKTFLIRYRAHGRKRFFGLGRYGVLTPDEARKTASELLVRVTKGADPAGERKTARAASTVGELAELFLADHVETKRKGSTAKNYRGVLEKYLLPEFGTRKVYDLKRADLARLHLSMRSHPYRANYLLAVVASMYSFAGRYGYAPEGFNPTEGTDRFPEAQRQRFLLIEEIGRLGDALRRAETTGLPWQIDEQKPTAKHLPKEVNRHTVLDPFAVAAIRLLILTGARLREILDARWDQVDIDRGIIHLADSKTGALSFGGCADGFDCPAPH